MMVIVVMIILIKMGNVACIIMMRLPIPVVKQEMKVMDVVQLCMVVAALIPKANVANLIWIKIEIVVKIIWIKIEIVVKIIMMRIPIPVVNQKQKVKLVVN